jgi:flagellar motor switch protein FliN/FliY
MSETDQLRKIFNENWISVFNTILGKDVTITIDSVKSADNADVIMNIEKFSQHIRLDYAEGDKAFIIMSQNNKMVSIVSNLMIGLDTFSDEISDDDRDAFSEAINQLFSSCQVPILDTLGVDVKFRNIHFIDATEATDLVHEKKWNLWNVGVDFAGISQEIFTLLVPSPFGEAPVTKESQPDYEEKPVDTHQSQPYNKTEFNYTGNGNINLLMDVELPVTIRIGSTEMKLIEIMRLGLGSIIELEKLVDDPVEVLVNNTLVARGEVVVYDSNFAIRITHVESRADRIRSLG